MVVDGGREMLMQRRRCLPIPQRIENPREGTVGVARPFGDQRAIGGFLFFQGPCIAAHRREGACIAEAGIGLIRPLRERGDGRAARRVPRINGRIPRPLIGDAATAEARVVIIAAVAVAVLEDDEGLLAHGLLIRAAIGPLATRSHDEQGRLRGIGGCRSRERCSGQEEDGECRKTSVKTSHRSGGF